MPPKKEKKSEDSNKNDKPAQKKSEPKGKVASGDIITLDFDAWIVDIDGTEELFDTTNEEHAKAGDIFSEKTKYGPVVTIVGDGRMIPGLDKALDGAEMGKKAIIEIPPEEGAGQRQPNMVEIFSMRELQKQDIDPEPGMRIQIKNKVGTITSMTSGRVRVDFNDPLAGKTLKYEYNITKKASNPEEKVLGIIEADYGRSEDFKASIKGDAVEIILADMCKYDQAWFTLKYKIVSDLRQYLDIKTIHFVEEYVKKEEAEEKNDAPEPVEETKELAPEELGSEEDSA